MKAFLRAMRFETRKTLNSVSFWVMTAILIAVQPILSFVEAISFVEIGLDATPETHPELAEPLAPVPFLGFDILPLGEVAVVAMAAILGSLEYRNSELRTTFLSINNRTRVVAAKFLSFGVALALVSLVSIYATIATTHVGLGDQGIDPVALSGPTWRVIGASLGYWVVLGVCCYAIALATKSWLVSMLVMAPQVVGVGQMLVSLWEPSRFLPVSAGRCMSATPDAACSSSTSATVVLIVWAVALVVVAWTVFTRRDVGAR